MKRALTLVAGSCAVLFSLACDRGGDDSVPDDGTERRTRAVAAASADLLAHPEFDLDVGTGFFAIGHRPASEIDDQIAAGSRLVSVDVDTFPYFNATFVDNFDPYDRVGTAWNPTMTEDEVNTLYMDTTKRIIDIAPYQFVGARLYAVVWVNNEAPQHFDYQIVLHATPQGFQMAMAGAAAPGAVPDYRVINLHAQAVPHCVFLVCTPDDTQYEVTGVGVRNIGEEERQQWFGYGPLVGNNADAAGATFSQASVGATISSKGARMADFDSPFGDGNFYYVAEEVRDGDLSLPVDNSCNKEDLSTERNWWMADVRLESTDDDPGLIDFLPHGQLRFGARTAKLKSYPSAAVGGLTRYLAVMYDNGEQPTNGSDNLSNSTLDKIDAAVLNRMKRWGIPGVSLAIVKDGRLIHAKGYGFSNLSTPRVTDPRDMFRLASVSKPINESLILRLIHDPNIYNKDGVTHPTLETTPFTDIFPDVYSPPAVSGSCDRDVVGGDASGCTLADIRIKDLLYHGSGVVTDADVSGDVNGFNLDIGNAHTPADWIKRELLHVNGDPANMLPPSPAFVAPPGTREMYMNSEYQILYAIVEALSGTTYDAYLASVLAPLGLDRIRPAHASTAMDVDGQIQSIPYPYSLPVCYGGKRPKWPNSDNAVSPSVDPVPVPPYVTRAFAGSGAMAASMVDLTRWASATAGDRGDYPIIGATMADTKTFFDSEFRAGYPNCRVGIDANCELPGAPPAGKPFEHGGYFPSDTQVRLRLNTSGISYAFAANGDSFSCYEDFCCPGSSPLVCAPKAASLSCAGGATPDKTLRWTHAIDVGRGTFDGELGSDLEIIFNHCAANLPARDLYKDFLSTEPQAVCKNVTVAASSGCSANVPASAVDAGSSGGSPTLVPDSPYPVGTTNVTLVVSNGTSSSTCSATITVTDDAPPTIICPADVTAQCTGARQAVVSAGFATGTDSCGGVTITNPPLASYPVGPTPATHTATDGSGHMTSCTNTVTVVDTLPPTITCPANITAQCTGSGKATVNTGAATATDVCGSVFASDPAPAAYNLGTTSVSHSATDQAGLVASCSHTVTVVDTTPPAITCPANVTAECNGAGRASGVSAGAATATEICTTATITNPPVASYPLGTTTVSHSARDVAGNTSSCTNQITVVDTTPPVLTVPPDITITSCGTPSVGTATATDACGAAPVTITNNKPPKFPAGTTVVTYTATDAAGNSTSKTQRVTVTVTLADDPNCCPGATNIIVGSSVSQTLTGTAGSDCILGLGANDTINGLGGDDFISGGEGDDIIDGGAGNDQLFGGGGQDQLTGGIGNDILNGGEGDDTCRAGDGDDILHGNNGQDKLYGDAGNDQLFGETGDDRLEGGAGNDALNGGGLHDVCVGGTGVNTFVSCMTQL